MTTTKNYLNGSFRRIFKLGKQFQNGVIAIKKERDRINLNKPIYNGTLEY